MADQNNTRREQVPQTVRSLLDYETHMRPTHLRGRRIAAKIRDIRDEVKHPNGKPTRTPVAYFSGKPVDALGIAHLGLPLSTTNVETLVDAFGHLPADFVGHWVWLDIETMQVAGEKQTPIRIAPAFDIDAKEQAMRERVETASAVQEQVANASASDETSTEQDVPDNVDAETGEVIE